MSVYQKLLFIFGTNFVKTAKQAVEPGQRSREVLHNLFPFEHYPAIFLNPMIQCSLGPGCLIFETQFKEQASAVTSKPTFQEIAPKEYTQKIIFLIRSTRRHFESATVGQKIR